MKKLLCIWLSCWALLAQAQQHTYVFIGSYNPDPNKEGIHVFELDTATGVLTKRSAVSNILNPSYIVLSPNGKNLYACTEANTPNGGALSCFQFDAASQQLSLLNSEKTGKENPVYASVHSSGRWLVAPNYSLGALGAFPLAADGRVLPAEQFIFFSDSSINKKRQDASHAHCAVFSPDEKMVFVPDLGADKIRLFQFDATANEPLKAATPPHYQTVPGSGPRHFTFHPNGRFAYCIEELSGSITAFRFSKNRLDSLQRVLTHPANYQNNYGSADIHISPDGKFLYASNRAEENNIAIFRIQKTGRLQLAGYQSTLGNHPRNFAITPNGHFLIVANKNSHNLFVFRRNAKTGLLQQIGGETKVGSPSCVQVRVY
jgi:6-phosphogluconolactonase